MLPTLWRRGDSAPIFSDLFPTGRGFDRWFESDLASDVTGPWMPAVDVRETDEAWRISVELPGVDAKDVEVSVDNGTLSVSGEKRHERDADADGYRVVERRYGRFERSFTVPRSVDASQVNARFDNGVLEVTLPKAAEAKPRRIKIG